MNKPLLALIGGFLGAGKTSLIRAAAHLLHKRGMRVAAILNDQDAGLVDTSFIQASHVISGEVAGGCFCCRFSDFLDVADSLRKHGPDVIFAEPVGSCIDLAATIVHPLKLYHGEKYRVAPITVLTNPFFAQRVYAGQTDSDTEYLFRQQIQEADILCSTRGDLPVPPDLGLPVDFNVSSRSGMNIELWLEEVLQGKRVAGSRLLEVDYVRYADAEAALGWLNFHAEVQLNQPASPAYLAGPLMEQISCQLRENKAAIAHFKVFDRTPSGYVKASICGSQSEPEVEGDVLADPARSHELAINLRAIADPELLSQIVSEAFTLIEGEAKILHHRSFRPPAPKPEYRMVRQDVFAAAPGH